MIVVTGGAGFIGSALVWKLNSMGYSNIIIVDNLGSSEKWKNLVPLKFEDYMDKTDFINKLEKNFFGRSIEFFFHLGACSSTTESNASYLMDNNYHYSVRIGMWWERHWCTRLIYASSAATYGAGENGYDDDESKIHLLKPLNMYGYSKHLFDLYALKRGWLKRIVGLKYFNVFGPNEYHKAQMRSLVNKAYKSVCDEGKITLFKSHRSDYRDGEQRRDFIYIKDALEMTVFFMINESLGGIYNIGTGIARTWNDLAAAMFSAVGRPVCIEYVPIPEEIRDKYQYYTQADITKLRRVGCTHVCMSLEDAVRDYLQNYLSKEARLT